LPFPQQGSYENQELPDNKKPQVALPSLDFRHRSPYRFHLPCAWLFSSSRFSASALPVLGFLIHQALA